MDFIWGLTLFVSSSSCGFFTGKRASTSSEHKKSLVVTGIQNGHIFWLIRRRALGLLCRACVLYLKHTPFHMHTSFSTLVYYMALAGKTKLETEYLPSVGLGRGFKLGKLAFLSGSVVPHRTP